MFPNSETEYVVNCSEVMYATEYVVRDYQFFLP